MMADEARAVTKKRHFARGRTQTRRLVHDLDAMDAEDATTSTTAVVVADDVSTVFDVSGK